MGAHLRKRVFEENRWLPLPSSFVSQAGGAGDGTGGRRRSCHRQTPPLLYFGVGPLFHRPSKTERETNRGDITLLHKKKKKKNWGKEPHKCENLDVILRSTLAWDDHVSAVVRRVNGVLLNLRSEAFGLPFNVRKRLIISTVLPHLDYVCVALLGISNKLESRLASLQNRAIRFIYHLKAKTPTSEYRRRLGWLSVPKRRIQMLATQVFKVLRDERPSYLFEKLDSHRAETRDGLRATSARVFDLPIPRSSAYANSFTYQGMSVWNQLPPDIRDASSLGSFKAKIYAHIFATDY